MSAEIALSDRIEYTTLADRLKLLAHPERLRILDVLRREPECVCHLEAALHKPQPYISQQLRRLRKAGIVVDERDGMNIFYRLADDQVRQVLDLTLGAVPSGHDANYQPTCDCPKCRGEVSG